MRLYFSSWRVKIFNLPSIQLKTYRKLICKEVSYHISRYIHTNSKKSWLLFKFRFLNDILRNKISRKASLLSARRLVRSYGTDILLLLNKDRIKLNFTKCLICCYFYLTYFEQSKKMITKIIYNTK